GPVERSDVAAAAGFARELRYEHRRRGADQGARRTATARQAHRPGAKALLSCDVLDRLSDRLGGAHRRPVPALRRRRDGVGVWRFVDTRDWLLFVVGGHGRRLALLLAADLAGNPDGDWLAEVRQVNRRRINPPLEHGR